MGWVASWRDTGGVDTAPLSPSALLWAPPELLQLTLPRGASGEGVAAGTAPPRALLPLCWPKDPCSQKPGQTPQARCVGGVPAPEGRGGVGKGGKVWEGFPLGAWLGAPVGSLPLSPPQRVSGHLLPRGPQPLFWVVRERKTTLKVAPLLSHAQGRGCRSSWGAGSNVPLGSAWGARYLGN